MRIQEILTEVTRPNSRGTAGLILHDAGYGRIGKGNNADVFWKPGLPYVLKLFESSERGYIDYVRIAKANPNPHFPVFKGGVIKINDRYNAIRMEKLDRLDFSYNIRQVLDGMSDYIDIVKGHSVSHSSKQVVIQNMERIESIQPGMTKACELIATIPDASSDLHVANVMMRGKTLVIIDPVTTLSPITGW